MRLSRESLLVLYQSQEQDSTVSLYLYRLRYSIRVLHHLVQEEFEERSWTEEDRGRPIRREGCGDHKLLFQLFNQVNQSRNHKGGILICPPFRQWCLLISL